MARAFTYFSMFVYIPARFLFALIGGNLRAQSTGCHSEVELKFQRRSYIILALPPFSALPPERPGELARRLLMSLNPLSLFPSLIYRHYNKFHVKELNFRT